MKVTITGRKVNLRDNFKELAQKKLSRFDRIFEDDAEAKVVVSIERNRQTVEITINNNGMLYRTEATEFEMNDALDRAVSALGRQIRKNKTRLEKKLHTAAIDQYIEEFTNAPEEETPVYNVARTKRFFLRPMSVEEAILQMDLLEHQFFLFREEHSEDVKVVYKRKDGGYGLLEPEL